jgi:hypothetical protein
MSFNFSGFNATALYFNETTTTGFDANTILSLLQSGNRIYVQQTAATNAAVYQVSGAGTHHTGYWEIPVVLIDSRGSLFANNADLTCVFILSVSSSPIGGSTTQVQYNNGGVFAGDADFTFDQGTNTLSIGAIEYTGTGQTPTNGIRSNTPSGLVFYVNGAPVGEWSAPGEFSLFSTSGGAPLHLETTTAGGDLLTATDGVIDFQIDASGTQLNLGTTTSHDVVITANSTPVFQAVAATGVGEVNDAGTMREVGFRKLPGISVTTPTTIDDTYNGKMAVITGTGTITGYAASDGVLVSLLVGVATTVAPGSGNLYWATAAGFTTGSRSIAAGSVASLWRFGGDWYLWGNGIT